MCSDRTVLSDNRLPTIPVLPVISVDKDPKWGDKMILPDNMWSSSWKSRDTVPLRNNLYPLNMELRHIL
jgi:hypothetical protein